MKRCKICGKQFNMLYGGYCKRCFQMNKMRSKVEVPDDTLIGPPINGENTVKAVNMTLKLSDEYCHKKFKGGK